MSRAVEDKSIIPCIEHYSTGRCSIKRCPYLHEVHDTDPVEQGRVTYETAKDGVEMMIMRVLPVFQWKECGDELCLICFEGFKGRLTTALPCLHKYHIGCILPWVRRHGACPICHVRFCEATTAPKQVKWIGTKIPPFTTPNMWTRIMQRFFGPVETPPWTPPSSACTLCATKFTLFLRRHHCRCCGVCVCSRCSSKQAMTQYTFKQICCDFCAGTYRTATNYIAPPWVARR
eukprot:TRINITY_DN24098_c0_g1_i1.p1 TRINITY_DN24098_c0_g1~~TRINITY_DN24098_c0_g1_i1.p1  ORF type:complete len:245 (+),score=23.56 TRINITY_DN24098_c0_g1_i1:42-737(+)